MSQCYDLCFFFFFSQVCIVPCLRECNKVARRLASVGSTFVAEISMIWLGQTTFLLPGKNAGRGSTVHEYRSDED